MKDCLILGPEMSLRYKGIFKLLQEKILILGIYTVNSWVGIKGGPQTVFWFTNLKVNRPESKKLKLTKTYNESDYEISDSGLLKCRSKDIPIDYDEKISVPMTFLHFYPDTDYEVLGFDNSVLFGRLIIRRKNYD